MKLGAVIPAAGRGSRMNTEVNKQYLQLGSRAVLAHTLKPFCEHSDIESIILPVKKGEIEYCRQNIVDKYEYGKVKLIAGGKTRRESVFAGLMAFSPAIDYVIIHDGARPLIRQKLLTRIIDSLADNRAVTAGIRVKDTIKVRDDRNFVVRTLPRDQLMSVQTPQAFAIDLLRKAHREVPESKVITDDASLVEELGYPVKIVEGSFENIKITTPVDLKYAGLILKNRGE